MVYLRGVHVGRSPIVWGRPIIEVAELVIGDSFNLQSKYRRTRLAGTGAIRIGDRVFINHGATIIAKVAVTIGDDVLVAEDVWIADYHGHGIEGRAGVPSPVTIGDGCWIGLRAVVMPGVTIGARSIVATGSIVTRDVPAETIVAGAPARHLRDLHLPAGVTTAWYGI